MSVTAVAEHKAHAMRMRSPSMRIDVLPYAEAHGWKREESGGA